MADLEADRLRALMRANVFKLPQQPVTLGRYEIVKLLGSGAMGIVYEAFDPRRGEHVALKTLRAHSPRALQQFKREFRALSRVTHPNLVALYELARDHDQYFFTMELVRGSGLLKYLWGADAAREDVRPEVSPVADFARLRAVFTQLVEGVYAIHQAHKLHRDIKPTNVMVTAQGRVVLMDFGFVGEESVGSLESTAGSMVVGTPAYMAPEQALGGRTPASDWYSVGATLYMVLTGQVPFYGENLAVMMERKQQEPPPPPRSMTAGVPEDLDALCSRLLQPDPQRRPTGPELLEFFHGERALAQRAQYMYTSPAATHVGARSFVGRAADVRALRLAFDEVEQRGAPAVALVRGRAGAGKSALIRHVTDGLRQRAAVLRARCYERDMVLYKALDSLVDALARHLRQREEDEVAAVLPPDLGALVPLFPVLQQAPAVAAATAAIAPPSPRRDLAGALRPDAPALRALRGLLRNLSLQRPLALWIDDLQWGDEGSVRALVELLRPPDAPRALLIASFRSEDEASPALRALQGLRDMIEAAGSTVTDLELAPLSDEEMLALGEVLLGPDTPRPRLERIAHEALGSPQLLHELARFVAHGAGSSPEITLDELLEIRVSRRSAPERRLLEVLAVAGGPLASSTLLAAADLGPHGLGALQQLHGAGLVRTTATEVGEALDVQHEHAREAVLARLDGGDLRDHHARLAAALERDPHADPAALAEHLRAAGDPARAHSHALRAARSARDAGDLERAANLLRSAGELAPAGQGPAVQLQLAETLARAGRGREAAEAYLAAKTGDAIADLTLTGHAAAHLLTSGHQARGREVLAHALAAAGLSQDDTSVRARLAALWRRGQKLVRGLDFHERAEDEIPRGDLVRVDLAFAAALGALASDLAGAADAQARHLLLSLRAGEPRRVARALALEALLLAPLGEPARARIPPLLDSARALAERHIAPAIAELADLVEATVAADPAAALARVEPLVRAGGPSALELPGARTLAILCQVAALRQLGRYAALREQIPQLLALSRAHDDRVALVWLGEALTWLHIAAADLAAARAAADACAAAWPEPLERGVQPEHVQALTARAHALVAGGEPLAAWALVDAAGPALARATALPALALRTQVHDLVGRVALAAAAALRGDPGRAGPSPEALRRAVVRSIDALQQDGARGPAAALRGGLALQSGDPDIAAAQYQAAAEAFAAAGMPCHQSACRLRLARLAGGDDPVARRTLAALAGGGPELLLALLVPGP